MNTNHRRTLVALATAFACLVLWASPASAATLTGTITAGTLTLISTTGTTTDTLPLGTGVICTNQGEVTTTGTTTSVTSWQVTVFSYVFRFKLGTTWYVVDVARTTSTTLNTPGTVTGVTTTSASLNGSNLNLRADIYIATNQSDTDTDCTHGTTRSCRFASAVFTVQGTYFGNAHTPAVLDSATLSGSGTLGSTSPPCNAPWTTYSTGTATVTGLTTSVTAVT